MLVAPTLLPFLLPMLLLPTLTALALPVLLEPPKLPARGSELAELCGRGGPGLDHRLAR